MLRIVEKIERVREARGLTQAEVEQACRLSLHRISKWGSGTGEPKASQACRIARFLEVPLEWLCDDDQTGDPPEPAASPAEGLTYDQRAVLDIFAACELTREQAIRALVEAYRGKPLDKRPEEPATDGPRLTAGDRRNG